MAKKTSRGRKQDRTRVAGGQDYEVRYEAKKTGKSAKQVRRAVSKVGPSRRKVERTLRRWTKDENRSLRGHSKSKTPVDKISRAMKRTPSALRQQALKLGIPLDHRR